MTELDCDYDQNFATVNAVVFAYYLYNKLNQNLQYSEHIPILNIFLFGTTPTLVMNLSFSLNIAL